MTDTKSAEQLAGEVKAAFDTRHDQVKAIAEEALGKAAKGEELSAAGGRGRGPAVQDHRRTCRLVR